MSMSESICNFKIFTEHGYFTILQEFSEGPYRCASFQSHPSRGVM